VQGQLRQAFQRWGQPRCLRVDNGKPWGSWSDLPTALALWAIGLGLEVLWIPPRQPQYNGVVERSQGTAKRWAEPWTCGSAVELQGRLDEADRLQREAYPLVKGRSRWEVFPGLCHSGRPYDIDDEEGLWSIERVYDHLSGYAVARQVDRSGKVSLYNRSYYVGTVHQRRQVFVMFDPLRREWLFTDAAGQQVRTQPAIGLETEQIRTLTILGPK
jgi:hypothetical protein